MDHHVKRRTEVEQQKSDNVTVVYGTDDVIVSYQDG